MCCSYNYCPCVNKADETVLTVVYTVQDGLHNTLLFNIQYTILLTYSKIIIHDLIGEYLRSRSHTVIKFIILGILDLWLID